jgi:hypothetical protein
MAGVRPISGPLAEMTALEHDPKKACLAFDCGMESEKGMLQTID